ncbi:MAG TPA: DHHA1 domain-containing protein, partial [Thermomicrobiales bacterium]|nr:DHHA1 domain-containing protein [Thermomicrobiales bacterium]
ANPQRGDDANAQILVGAGLAWLVIRALAAQCALGPDGAAIAERSLDLAAIGTIGDVGLLQGVNRALVIAGAPAIRKAHRLGLKTLTRRMNLEPVSLNAESISMRLVPKLNGVGRIYTAALAIDLLLETNWDAAEEQVRQMLAIDLDRKQAQQAIIDTISASLANGGAADQVLVLHDPAWKHGLVGAVASRMVNTVGRPLILLGGTGEMIGGSARSVAEWDIAQALQQVPDGLLERTGGHSKAAGLALRRDDLDAFRTAINAIFAESGLTVPIPDTINLDADIEDDGLSIPMLQELDRLGPYGNGNHRPMLRWQQVRISDLRAVGQDQTTANFFVSHGMHRQKVVMFRSFDLVASLADQTVDVVIQAQIDMFKGQKQLNAQVVDMHPSD